MTTTTCNVCNGSYTYVAEGNGFALVMPCYDCGTMPKEQQEREFNEFLEKIRAAKAAYSKGATVCTR